ncbi:hypothetical protein C8P63_11663 [Melghirimyces profundicolus]|uniref:Uncharacterized protein n=1 Tax=Melghirimyces profundicolus TaxID=1242148 RepID=A0A2T6BR01_9BACL|nr:hypothetical protein [Melghirimyces profundicolus]PTX58476.1 hypothetical protein C8P63_11663 [Melghirimyces profundicolus]
MDRHGNLLHIFTAFGVALSILVLFWLTSRNSPAQALPDLYRFLLWSAVTGNIVLLTGICFRKRWALYGYFSLVLLLIPNAVIVVGPSVLAALAGPLFLWLLVRNRWHQFH